MKTYQIRFIKSGRGHYEYFDAEPENAPAIACQTANEYLRGERGASRSRSWPFWPANTAEVWEYKNQKGLRFQICLRWIERDGAKGYWYVPAEE